MTAHVGAYAPSFVYSQTISEMLLSDPFVRGHPVAEAGPANARGHALSRPTLPQKAAFIDGTSGASISFARLRKDSLRFASGLRNKLGLKPAPFRPGPISDPILSPVVLLHLPNCIPFVVCEIGAWAAGLTATTVNFAYRATELAHIIEASKPSVIVTLAGADGLEAVQQALKEVPQVARDTLRNRIFTVELANEDYGLAPIDKPRVSTGKYSDWKALLDAPGSEKEFIMPKYDAKNDCEEAKRRTALILWSSGTTGKSKGVVISHAYLTYNLQAAWFSNTQYKNDEVFMGLPPFFHVFGLSNVMNLGIAAGYTTVIISKFDPRVYMELMQRYGATHLHIAAPVGVILAKAPFVAEYDFSTVRAATSGGAPLGWAVIEMVWKRLGFLIRMGYGTSEHAGSTQTYHLTWDKLGAAKTASGQPMYGTEVKIMSVDHEKKTLAIGQEGEICIRSGSLMNCYLDNPAATAESMTEDGWNRTGDVGLIDTDGNLHITDRLKEMIKVKGFQCAPSELEALINSLDSVADTGVTSVYSDDDATEYPIAYVVPRNTQLLEACEKAGKATIESVEWAHSVRRFVEEKLIDYKWLRGGLVILPALPKSNAGKLLRKDFKSATGHFVQLYVPKKRPQAKL